jgi:hypothetical protein
MRRRFLGLMTVGNAARQEMNKHVESAAMARALNLRDVLQLVVDALEDGAFAQDQLIGKGEQAVAPVLA